MDSNIIQHYLSAKAKPDETLHDHTNRLLMELDKLVNYGFIKDDKVERLARFACMYHDVGKLNPLFNERLMSKSKFNASNEVGHNILSAALVSILLKEVTDPRESLILQNAILNHHHYIENYSFIKDNIDLIVKNSQLINEKYFNYSSEEFERNIRKAFNDRRMNHLKAVREEKDYILVKGFLHKCDYSASAHIHSEIPNDFLKESVMDVAKSKGYKLNELQEFCISESDKNLAIIGSTGLGKTEASLLWAGNNKIFYVLPLRTAINAMYDRMKNDYVSEDYNTKLGLLHGETASKYLQKSVKDQTSGEKESESDKFYNYYDLTKNMSLPITITTPDQIFNFVFKSPGYELKLATLSYSKVIIDEIQAYSPDILAYTIHAINEIVNIGGKIAIFTATLAPFVRDLLRESNQNVEFVENVFLTDMIRHSMKLINDRISGNYIYDFMESNKRDKRKSCLVVMNTIKDAQIIFAELKELFGDTVEFNLLHSKFTIEDRKSKEEQILRDGNREIFESSESSKDVIWVTTQLVEASLDIDFDYLFTELSELLGLFQRMGRCYRKRVISGGEPNVFLFTEIRDSILTNNEKGFIDRGLYELSKEALVSKGDGIITELDKYKLIEEYFTMEKLRSQRFSKFLSEYKERLNFVENLSPESIDSKELETKFRNIVSYKAIPESIYLNSDGSINENILRIVESINEIRKEISFTENENEKKRLRKELIILRDEINSKTISVEYWYLKGAYELKDYPYEKIYIIKFKYDPLIGLQNKLEDREFEMFL